MATATIRTCLSATPTAYRSRSAVGKAPGASPSFPGDLRLAMGPLDVHVERLRARYANARVLAVNGSGSLISLPDVSLVGGWSKAATEVHFFAPEGYPYAKPDCFWADEDLRLANGAMPQATNLNAPAGLGRTGLWFSWHTDHWNAGRDDLLTWVASIKDRLGRAV